MPNITDEYLQTTNSRQRIQGRFWRVTACLSAVVILCVFWYLKLTGITLAGEAFCGMSEHQHTDACQTAAQPCTLEEHIHVESCYSDLSADLETADDWEADFADIPRGSSTAENIVLLAQSQLGYAESTRNFEVDSVGVRRGITRYGQWYGNPYGDWSAMFAAFCLHYAGVEDVPLNAGAESMRLAWEAEGSFKPAAEYAPQVGDLLFLRKSEATYTDRAPAADTVAIITAISAQEVTVIEGDVEGVVAEVTYPVDSESILGYGLTPEQSGFAVLVEPPAEMTQLAATAKYQSSMLTSSNRFVLYTMQNGNAYAIDGTGNAVLIHIDENGKILADTDQPDMLMWTFSRYNNNSTAIQNVGSGRYLHPFYNSATDNGITTPGRWGTTVSGKGDGVTLSHSAYIALDAANGRFYMTRTQSQNVSFLLGMSSPCAVWLDGTNGGIMGLGGSEDRRLTVYTDSTLTLPTEWKSPEKYPYTLKGWYDVVNHKYYTPGDKVIVTGNTVFYADWKAASYDFGRFNSHTDADTISTKQFVTTRMFDYGALMNVLSERVNVTVNDSSHSETWQLLTSGNNPYNGDPTLNFIFRDWDRGNEDISYPSGHNDRNNPTSAGTVFPGLYTDTIRDVLFDPNIVLPGKEYLGEGDFLFQLCEDPSHSHYGYYYYNSERNAASYNQTDQRFYVYDYLEATRDSTNSSGEGKYTDFLPLNSPYVTPDGRSPTTYTYDGVEGEYVGTTHYMYDSRYNDNGNSTANISTNYWFGMSVDVNFYIPNAPGGLGADGEYGNKDIYGADMHFRFTGDDDVWVFVDGQMVLDLGGLHGRETGDINFSTGDVTINGTRHDALSNTLRSISAGEHTLTLYYLERGSSLSNCAIYFNLAPRFAFSIQKEDVLTKEVLNGAQFSVFTDKACTVPAELWESKEAHDSGLPATNVFTVKKGVANMWGMGAGNVYYIRETKPPNDANYGFPNGIISVTFDKGGTASYNVEILEDENGISPGFIVHGFRIDTETQQAYIIATNAPHWVKETTSVQMMKQWNDSLSHSNDTVTVYLTVTDPDGVVRRLQEAVLSKDTDWMARWDNLPKYAEDGKTLIRYDVEESYVSGYYSTVERAEGHFEVVSSSWQSTNTFTDGKVYLLKRADGMALSTQRSAEDTGYMWVDEDTAQGSPLAQWTASVKNGTVRLTNQAGQTITLYYGNGRPTDFYAYNRHVEDSNRKQFFTFTRVSGGITLRYSNYYLASDWNGSQKFNTTTRSSSALVLTPYTEVATTVDVPVEDQGFLVNNTPLEKETSVTVRKEWSIPHDMNASVYEQEQVTIKLFANGLDTGRTVTLNLKNSWQAAFLGLPYADANDNPILYTVEEVPIGDRWVVSYGNITASGGSPPNYSVTVVNTYRTGGPPLPTTGSPARLLYILCGAGIILVSLIYGLWFKLRCERRVT